MDSAHQVNTDFVFDDNVDIDEALLKILKPALTLCPCQCTQCWELEALDDSDDDWDDLTEEEKEVTYHDIVVGTEARKIMAECLEALQECPCRPPDASKFIQEHFFAAFNPMYAKYKVHITTLLKLHDHEGMMSEENHAKKIAELKAYKAEKAARIAKISALEAQIADLAARTASKVGSSVSGSIF